MLWVYFFCVTRLLILVNSTEKMTPCEPADFCDDSSIQYKINYEENESLDNWYLKLNLACESTKTIGIIGSSYFFGMAVGCMIIPRLADLYGRRNFTLGCNIAVLPLLCSFYYMNSALDAIIRLFFVGCGFSGFVIVNFQYMMEF